MRKTWRSDLLDKAGWGLAAWARSVEDQARPVRVRRARRLVRAGQVAIAACAVLVVYYWDWRWAARAAVLVPVQVGGVVRWWALKNPPVVTRPYRKRRRPR